MDNNLLKENLSFAPEMEKLKLRNIFNSETHMDELKRFLEVDDNLSSIKSFFSARPFDDELMDVPVDPPVAEGAIRSYREAHDAGTFGFTDSVSFNGTALLAWLNDLSKQGEYTDIRLEFGAYTQEMIDGYSLPSNKLGRTTIFIAAYKGNSRAVDRITGAVLPLYNIGHLHP